jgi:hypothetical protein
MSSPNDDEIKMLKRLKPSRYASLIKTSMLRFYLAGTRWRSHACDYGTSRRTVPRIANRLVSALAGDGAFAARWRSFDSA